MKLFEIVIDGNEGATINFNSELVEAMNEEKINNVLDKNHEDMLIDVINHVIENIKIEANIKLNNE